MAAKKTVLATHVHVDGEVYAAGTVPPPEVAELITNPKAWIPDEVASASSDMSQSDSEPEKKHKGKKDKPVTEPASATEGGGTSSDVPQKPPAVGAGSGTAEWLAYARSLGLTVTDDAKKGELVEAVAEFEAKGA